MGKPSKDYAVPLWEKANLTVYEAAAYSGIGADKLRELSDREDCEFVLWNGTKRLIKRKKLLKLSLPYRILASLFQTVVIGILKPNENEGGNRYDQAGKR